MDEMDHKLAASVSRVARRHVTKGTPIEHAWPDVVRVARRAVGAAVARAALEVPLTQGLATVIAEYAALLGRNRPSKSINGLWFGLVEFVLSQRPYKTVWTPYIAGSKRFHPRRHDWPVRPAWMPPDCYAPNEAMNQLSKLRERNKAKAWYIETTLIEPLNMLLVSRIARDVPAHILLGDASSRGIGCGFDDGDLYTLGVVGRKGFKPEKAR